MPPTPGQWRGGSGQRQRTSVGRGRQSPSLRDGQSAQLLSSPCLSVTSLSDPQVRWFCVLTNHFHCTSQHGLEVEPLSVCLGCCWRLSGRVGKAKTRGERCFCLPRGKFTSCSGHHTAPCRRCHRQTEGEQNLCVVTLTSAPNTCVLVCCSSTVFSCSATCKQN